MKTIVSNPGADKREKGILGQIVHRSLIPIPLFLRTFWNRLANDTGGAELIIASLSSRLTPEGERGTRKQSSTQLVYRSYARQSIQPVTAPVPLSRFEALPHRLLRHGFSRAVISSDSAALSLRYPPPAHPSPEKPVASKPPPQAPPPHTTSSADPESAPPTPPAPTPSPPHPAETKAHPTQSPPPAAAAPPPAAPPPTPAPTPAEPPPHSPTQPPTHPAPAASSQYESQPQPPPPAAPDTAPPSATPYSAHRPGTRG